MSQDLIITMSSAIAAIAAIATVALAPRRRNSEEHVIPSETPTLDLIEKYMGEAIEGMLDDAKEEKDRRDDGIALVTRTDLVEATIVLHNDYETRDYALPKKQKSDQYADMQDRFEKAIRKYEESGQLFISKEDSDRILLGVGVDGSQISERLSPPESGERRKKGALKNSSPKGKKRSREEVGPDLSAKWLEHVSNFGLVYAQDRRRQMQRIARRWVVFARDNDFSPDNSNPELVAKFLDKFDISKDTYKSYKGILDKWFVEVGSSRSIVGEDSSHRRDTVQKVKRSSLQTNQRVKIVGYSYEGQVFQCDSAKEALVSVLQQFQSEDPQFLERLAEKSRSGGSKRVLVSMDRKELYPGEFKARSRDYGDLGSGWWVSTNRSRNNIIRQIEIACDVKGVTFGEDLEILTEAS